MNRAYNVTSEINERGSRGKAIRTSNLLNQIKLSGGREIKLEQHNPNSDAWVSIWSEKYKNFFFNSRAFFQLPTK